MMRNKTFKLGTSLIIFVKIFLLTDLFYISFSELCTVIISIDLYDGGGGWCASRYVETKLTGDRRRFSRLKTTGKISI